MRQKLSAFFQSVTRVFMPPFDGLPLVMWCYVVLSYIALPRDPIWLGDLPDPDDYTYLTQTLDWLRGQGWFDNVQHRMFPPQGVPIHYTRLAEMPIAATIMLFRAFHYSWRGAALLASFLLPVVYLGVFFAALRRAAARIINPDYARLSSFIVMFGGALMFKFAPGQVDHHGLEAILTITAVGLTAHMFAQPDRWRWAISAAFVLALSLAIALEVLPWVALISAIVGLWTVAVGRKAARSASVFGISLFIASAGFLALEKPAADYLAPDLLAYSIAYVALNGGIALALLAAAGASRINKFIPRLLLSAAAALVLGAIYLHRFPALLAGPYGAMDPRLAALFFGNLEEAVAMAKRYTIYETFLCLTPPLIALASSIVFMSRAQGSKKWQWLLLAALLAASILLATFYQIRVLLYALLFSVIPLTAFVESGWAWIGAHCRGRQQFWAEIALILSIGPLTAIFLPALQDGRSFSTGMMLFPAQSFNDTCQMRELEQILNAAPYNARPLRIANMIDSGPELLFRTAHMVLSAPYHTNVGGNLDALDLFSTLDPEQAHRVITRDGIDLLVLCRAVPDMYLAGDQPHYVVLPDGQERMRPNPSFAGQLAAHHPPDWLREIPLPGSSNYLLFAVK